MRVVVGGCIIFTSPKQYMTDLSVLLPLSPPPLPNTFHIEGKRPLSVYIRRYNKLGGREFRPLWVIDFERRAASGREERKKNRWSPGQRLRGPNHTHTHTDAPLPLRLDSSSAVGLIFVNNSYTRARAPRSTVLSRSRASPRTRTNKNIHGNLHKRSWVDKASYRQ